METEEAVEEAAAELYLTRHSAGLRGRPSYYSSQLSMSEESWN